jgi:hypothetical protein
VGLTADAKHTGVRDLPGLPRSPLPLLAPMLAVTAPTLPADQATVGFEPKLDGFLH